MFDSLYQILVCSLTYMNSRKLKTQWKRATVRFQDLVVLKYPLFFPPWTELETYLSYLFIAQYFQSSKAVFWGEGAVYLKIICTRMPAQ